MSACYLFAFLFLKFRNSKSENNGRGAIPNSLLKVRGNSQSRKIMYWLAEIMLDCESKLNDIKQDGSVTRTELVHTVYFVKSGFPFGLKIKSLRAPYTEIFLLSK